MSRIVRNILKYLAIIFGTLSVIAAAILVFLHYSLKDMCGNEIHQQVESPDKKYKAVIFQRDCGATTGFSTQVSIIENNKDLPDKSGNIFIANGSPDQNQIKIAWLNDNKIEIIENIPETFLKENKFQDIEIIYNK